MLPLLSSLRVAWERRAEIAYGTVVVLVVALYVCSVKIKAQRQALAAQPVIERERETHTVKAPTVIKEKITRTVQRASPEDPKSCPIKTEIVERVIYEGEVTTDTSATSSQRPVGPAVSPVVKRWYAGASISPYALQQRDYKAATPRPGITIRDRLDVGLGYDPRSPFKEALRIEAALRF